MINTRENVADDAISNGLEPIQIDGIPEGFSFLEPDLTIGNVKHSGQIIAYIPNYTVVIKSHDLTELLQEYNLNIKKRDAK